MARVWQTIKHFVLLLLVWRREPTVADEPPPPPVDVIPPPVDVPASADERPPPPPVADVMPPPPVDEPPTPEPEPSHPTGFADPPPLAKPRRAKWAKPKNTRPKREAAAEPRKPSERKPKKPPQYSDDDPEQWGQFYFRDVILDQLDVYFTYLRRLKHRDPGSYERHRRLGIQLMPHSAVNGFNQWRSEGQLDELSAWFAATRPAFGAIAYGIDPAALRDEKIMVVEEEDLPPDYRADPMLMKNPIATITRHTEKYKGKRAGRVWIPKFLYFNKYALPPPEIQAVGSEGDVYEMTVYWDRIDTPLAQMRKGGVPQNYAVCVNAGAKTVRVLRMLIHEEVKIRTKHGKERGQMFSVPSHSWKVPIDILNWAVGRSNETPEQFLARLFVEAALMYESSVLGSMVRIEVTKGDLVATFGVDIKRMAYFFKDRDVTLNAHGKTARIFHIVRPHERVMRDGSTRDVHMHFRGLREFEWAGHKVHITVPGLDHIPMPEFDVGSLSEKNPKFRQDRRPMLDEAEAAQKLVDYIHGHPWSKKN